MARRAAGDAAAEARLTMWTLAWWWMLAALPLPWIVRRVVRPDALDRDAALKVPVAAEFADLAGIRAPDAARRWPRFGCSRSLQRRGRNSSASPSHCR